MGGDFAGWPVWGWLSRVVFLASIGVPSGVIRIRTRAASRLPTSPTLTGSPPVVKTMGIVEVNSLATNTELFPPVARDDSDPTSD